MRYLCDYVSSSHVHQRSCRLFLPLGPVVCSFARLLSATVNRAQYKFLYKAFAPLFERLTSMVYIPITANDERD